MRDQLETYAARIAAQMQSVGANVDPEILQLPGGSIIATLLWVYAQGARISHAVSSRHHGISSRH